jgi:hypothetical protein
MTHDIELLRLWLRVVLVIAALAATSFPFVYSITPWRSLTVGRVLMHVGISLALALDMTVLFTFWAPNVVIRLWISGIVVSYISISISRMTYQVWKANFSRKKKRYGSHRQSI